MIAAILGLGCPHAANPDHFLSVVFMSLSQIIARRRQCLLSDFVRGIPPLVEVESAAGLGSLMHLDEFLPGAAPSGLGRRATGNVVMITGAASQTDTATLWVRASYSDYRAAYAAFMRSNYGLTVTSADLAAYDVDHLLNRARAGLGTALLRIEALPLLVNRQWGGFLERLASSAQIHGNSRTRRLMSYLIAGKVAGLQPPAALDDLPGRHRLAQGLAALGLPQREVEDGLADMLDHIARNQR